MTKKLLTLACVVGMLFLAACSNITIDQMPTLDEIESFKQSHTEAEFNTYAAKVIGLVSDMGDDAIYSAIEKAFDKWAGGQQLIKLEDAGVKFSNTLKVNETYNQKWFRQVAVTASIHYDPKQISGQEAQVLDRVFEDMCAALKADTVGHYKIASIQMDCYGSGNSAMRNQRVLDDIPNGGNFSELYDKIDWQPQGEKAAQTIAFEFAAQVSDNYFPEFTTENKLGIAIRSFRLTHFGIAGGHAYAKMATSDLTAGRQYYEGKLFEDSLEDICKQLAARIEADKAAKDYIKNNGGKIVIEIEMPGMSVSQYLYTHTVK